MRILNEKQEQVLKEERRVLQDLRDTLVDFGAEAADLHTLSQSLEQLDELFLLVVVGEFNAGKSAFINALLGSPLLKEGVTPTTTRINILRYGPAEERTSVDANLDVVRTPLDLLTDISIVDTPGTNAIIREHEVITAQFVPRSDLVLFITSADRPFTESERVFMERIRDWGKKVVVVVNKIDILQSDAELTQVADFIEENARILLGISPEIFPVSARQALQAKTGQPNLWLDSRFELLERYILEVLDDRSRLQLKLQNPLGVGGHLVDRYAQIIQDRLGILGADIEMLTDVEAQLQVYQDDMHRDFEYRMSDIEKILYEMEQRGDEYFDRTIRLLKVFDLLKKEQIQQEFETEIVGEVPEQIERKVDELIDWLVESDLRQWQAVMEHVAERRREHQERIVGDQLGGEFQYDRQRLMDEIGDEAREVVESFDKKREAQAMAESTQTAVAAAAALEVSAVGLGALVTVLATTVAADVTGILLASFVAALGLFVIPARRRRAKQEMHQKVAEMRTQLTASLREHFEQEIEASIGRINEAIAPYSRFVRAERQKLTQRRSDLEQVKNEISRLRGEIDNLE